MSNEERTIKYIGGGAWIPGVPARDLTPAEYKKHQEAIEAAAQASPYGSLYQKAPSEPQKTAKASKSTGKG